MATTAFDENSRRRTSVMPDKALAPEASHDLQQLHPLSPPTASSHEEVIESAFEGHDTARFDMLQDLEPENDDEDVGSQKSTAYTALLDVPLISRCSSSAENTEISAEALHQHVPASDRTTERRISSSAVSEHGQGTTLSFRFGSILALIDGLIRKLGELPDLELAEKELAGKKLMYTRLRDILAFLRECVLDLRIWLQDLTTNDTPALDRLDNMKHPERSAAAVIIDLHDNMTDISNILLPLAAQLHTHSLDESESIRPQASAQQSNRANTKNTFTPSYGGILLELSMACNGLKASLGKLLAQKSAVKEVLACSSTERLAFTENVAPESKAEIASSVLSFDGGGVKSYSSLLILKALMERVQSVLQEEETPINETKAAEVVQEIPNARELKPADIFNFMYGSSSGGLIAIMLGRLGMTVDECIAKYLEYTTAIFKRPRFFSRGGYLRSRYSQKRLIQATRRIVGEFHPSSKNEGWRRNVFSSSDVPCKTGVIAYNSKRFESYMFRTYDCFASPDQVLGPLNPGPADSHQIWEIAMATSAAPTFFDPVNIEGQVFVDGGITANNPTREALRDVESLHNKNLSHICVVSIGSGLSTKQASKTTHAMTRKIIFDTAINIITQTESTHRTVNDFLERLGASYFRFNISGVRDIRLDECQEYEVAANVTHQHLQDSRTQKMLDDCASVLVRRLKEREGKSAKRRSGTNTKQSKIDEVRPNISLQRQNVEAYNTPFNLRGVPIAGIFIDRPLEIAELETAFFSDRNNRRKICILGGLGGIGKTQLSVEFARRHCNRFSLVLWLDGRTEDTLRQSIAAIAQMIPCGQSRETSKDCTPNETADLDAVIENVINWLSLPDNGSWLLVYDNVDNQVQALQVPFDTYDIRDYFPKADHGSILITTRLLSLGQLGTQLIVGRMNPEQAAAMFMNGDGKDFEGELPQSRLKESVMKMGSLTAIIVSDESKKLLDILGGLPLALAQASTFMRETATSFSDYLKIYEEQWTELMESSQMLPQDSSNRSVLTTWTVSYNAIKQIDERAAKLLQLWACLDNNELWFELFQPGLVKLTSVDGCTPQWFQMVAGSKLAFLRSIKLLLGCSIINGIGGSSRYSIHPVVHEWAWQMQEEDSRTELIALATIIIGSAVPHNSDDGFWIMQRRLIPHANRCVRRISEGVGKSYALQSKFDAYENKESWHRLISEAFSSLGNLYMEQGYLAKAEEMYLQALRGFEIMLGPEHPSTLSRVNDLGRLYTNQGKLKEAELMYERALVGIEKALGPKHPSTLTIVNNLGRLYADQSRLMEAESMYLQALRGSEKVLGLKHLFTLSTVSNLGRLYADQGKLMEAESMYQRALVGMEKALGSEHPSTLKTVNNLGRLYADQGRLMEAELMYQRALVGIEKALGSEHPSTLSTVKNLGRLYADQGRLIQAEEMYQRALRGFKEVFGSDHRLTLDVINDLGVLCTNQGKLEEAELMYMQALRGKEKALGVEHISTLCTINDLGLLYTNQGRLAEAEKMYQRALGGYEKVLGPEHVSTLDTMKYLGTLYANQGKTAEAEKMHQQALSGYAKLKSGNHQ